MFNARALNRRDGISLLEVLIVITILGLLAALSLVAIQVVRESALSAKSLNNLRQIALGFHDYASIHAGQLPRSEHFPDGAWRSRLSAIVLHVNGPEGETPVQWLLSPADPTVNILQNGRCLCSYCMNWQVFKSPNVSLTASIPDGLSSTFLLAEMYSVCNGDASSWCTDNWVFARIAYFGREFIGENATTWSYRWDGMTFQVRPCTVPKRQCGATPNCFTMVAQTPHRGGMLVAMADGSGRSVSPSISYKTYWDLVSPAGGELTGDDW